ncbi:MAG: pyruvate dehydrogenase (acetyl-transferring) E1 component subunit alpha [Chloroflexi bacterium]|nr:pyruvate dehydrogenase (acetyl-transferring) E1 component subunit alpha [Chloroflexota bacterium]
MRPNADRLILMYRNMVLIRKFEERSAGFYREGKIGGFLHLYIGEEAVGVGAIAALAPQDYIVTHYRDHGHAIARGLDPKALMAELLGRSTGVAGGKGGSMHLVDVSKGFWGGYGIVGGHIALATGLALASQYQDENRVTLCIFGDGSTNIGYFHESLNLASLWKLPVLYLCENNLYGMGTAVERASAVASMAEKACAYNIPAVRIDGMDTLKVFDATQRAIEHVRSGNGPYFIEAMCYRFPGHSMGDPERYRVKDEVDRYKQRDPIVAFGKQLEGDGVVDEADLERIEREVAQEMDAVASFADASPAPAPESMYDFIYAQSGTH